MTALRNMRVTPPGIVARPPYIKLAMSKVLSFGGGSMATSRSKRPHRPKDRSIDDGHRHDGKDSNRSEDKIDESSRESFPASDPPSWTVLTRVGSPR